MVKKKRPSISFQQMHDEYYGEIDIKDNYVDFIIHKFPTHVIKRERKTKPDLLIKINGQTIYNGALQRHDRANVKTELHKILTKDFKHLKDSNILKHLLPGKLTTFLYVIPDYHLVKCRSKIISYPPISDKTYTPTFDAFNQTMWIKAFEDCLVGDLGLIPDDNVKYLPDTGRMIFIPINNFEYRKIVFRIEKCSKNFQKLWENFFDYWPNKNK